jgi:Group II intron, maturase-specific domain
MIGSEIDWHGGKAAIRRPRVRHRGGAELELPSWTAIQKADLLSRWAFNQMLIGVATRKYARSVRLPDGDLAGQAKRATTKSSVSRRFVALSTAKLKEWLAADLSGLDLLVIQIDGLHVGDHVLVAAIGIDGAGDKHVLSYKSLQDLAETYNTYIRGWINYYGNFYRTQLRPNSYHRDHTVWLGISDSNCGIRARAIYLRCRDNFRWISQASPPETIRG